MSPILAENKARYPKEWPAISRRVRRRSRGRCECRSECGRLHVTGRCGHRQRRPMESGKLCILTVAHLDHQPEHCAEENLRAMCQGCHNRYDRDHRRTTRESRCPQTRLALYPVEGRDQ